MIPFKEFLNRALVEYKFPDDPFAAHSNVERRERGEPDFDPTGGGAFALNVERCSTDIRWLIQQINQLPKNICRIYTVDKNQHPMTMWEGAWNCDKTNPTFWSYDVELINPNLTLRPAGCLKESLLTSLHRGLTSKYSGRVLFMDPYRRILYTVSSVTDSGRMILQKVFQSNL